MSNELGPFELEALARMHQQHVLNTHRLYGQRNGIDQPEDSDRLPLSGAHEWCVLSLRTWAAKTFEMLLIVLLVFVLVGITMSSGPTP